MYTNQSYRIIDGSPINLLFCILLLLEFKDVFIKIKLQILVCIIDAQLFEAILREIFETEDVENRNSSCLLRALVNDMVDTCD